MSDNEDSNQIEVSDPGVSGNINGEINSNDSSVRGDICYTNSDSTFTTCVNATISSDIGDINPSSIHSIDTSDKGSSIGVSFTYRFK